MIRFIKIPLIILLTSVSACDSADDAQGGPQIIPPATATTFDADMSDSELRRAMRKAARLENQQQYDEAIAIYEEQLSPGPNEHVVKNNLSALLLDGRSDAESHKRALDLMQPYVSAASYVLQDTLGWAYYRNGDYLKAIRHLEYAAAYEATAALDKPQPRPRLSPNIRFHLAMAYAKAGITSGALHEISRAIELAPEDWKYADEATELLNTLTQ